MIKGEISRVAEVNKERQPDYKQGEKRGRLFFVSNLRIYSTFKREKGNSLTSVNINKVLD